MNPKRNVIGLVAAAALVALGLWLAAGFHAGDQPTAPADGVTPPAAQPAP